MAESPDDEFSRIGDSLRDLSALLDRASPLVRAAVVKELQPLMDMVRARRNPRVMIMGRRGSGKSSVINALLGTAARPTGAVEATTGAPVWEPLRYRGQEMDLLDTRGVQEGSKPVEDDDAATAEASLLAEVRKTCPDVIVFVVKAEDVDSAIEGDLSALETIHAEATRVHGTPPRILPVLNQCDKLHPTDIRLSEIDAEKRDSINGAIRLFRKHLASCPALVDHLVPEITPVSAQAVYDANKEIIPGRDYRWNIDLLAERISEALPDAAQLAFVRLARFRKVQRQVAGRVVVVCAGAAGVVGLQPIPGADFPFIAAIQATMILVIAYISGERIDVKSVARFLTGLGVNIAGGVALREVARALIKFLPVGGSVISGAVASTGTAAIGRAAIAFYIDKSPMDEAKRIMTTRTN